MQDLGLALPCAAWIPFKGDRIYIGPLHGEQDGIGIKCIFVREIQILLLKRLSGAWSWVLMGCWTLVRFRREQSAARARGLTVEDGHEKIETLGRLLRYNLS